jgi:[acyl-carrier-protein] S-malonyltransferase
MKKYFLFPGQGSQSIGMGKALTDAEPEAKARFNEACDILGFDIQKICFEGPEEALRATENTQPALFITSFVVYECFKRAGIQPDFTAGHSLGEYTAIAAAGGFDFATGLKLVRTRGQLMAKAKTGTMAAVVGLDRDTLESICTECSADKETVVPANFNAPDQTVISGSVQGVKDALEKMKTAGAKRVIALPVSGAFHSPLMNDAAEQMKAVLDQASIQNTRIPVIGNVTAKQVTNGTEIKSLLCQQLVSPVQWVLSFTGAEEGRGIEMGPGRVLMGLMRRINRNISVLPAHTPEEIDKVKEAIGE